MTQYNWIISAFDTITASEIITNVHWKLRAEREGIIVDTYGCTLLPIPKGDIIEYGNLTKEQIIIWLENIMSIIPKSINGMDQKSQLETIKQSLEKRIDKKLTPINETIKPTF